MEEKDAPVAPLAHQFRRHAAGLSAHLRSHPEKRGMQGAMDSEGGGGFQFSLQRVLETLTMQPHALPGLVPDHRIFPVPLSVTAVLPLMLTCRPTVIPMAITLAIEILGPRREWQLANDTRFAALRHTHISRFQAGDPLSMRRPQAENTEEYAKKTEEQFVYQVSHKKTRKKMRQGKKTKLRLGPGSLARLVPL